MSFASRDSGRETGNAAGLGPFGALGMARNGSLKKKNNFAYSTSSSSSSSSPSWRTSQMLLGSPLGGDSCGSSSCSGTVAGLDCSRTWRRMLLRDSSYGYDRAVTAPPEASSTPLGTGRKACASRTTAVRLTAGHI